MKAFSAGLLVLSLLAANAGASSAPKSLDSVKDGSHKLLLNNQKHAHSLKPPRGGGSEAIDFPLKRALPVGIALAFNSGFMNGACLAGAIVPSTKQAVAAVTGAWTTSAVGFASGNTKAFQTQMTMIASYAGGSAIASLLNPFPTPFQVKAKTVGPGFLLCSAMLWLAAKKAAAGETGLSIFILAAVANGLQNSITSVHSGNLIRTAHYSGMTSDIGTFFGQCLRGNKANLYKLQVNLALALAFWVGGFLSFFSTQKYTTTTLLFSAIMYALFGVGAQMLK